MKLKLYQNNILSILIIAVGGFVLFNLAFVLAALIIKVTMSVLGMGQNEAPPILGRSFYQQSKWIIVGIGAVIICALLSYLYKKKLSWLYYFATFYVVVLALCVMLFDIQI